MNGPKPSLTVPCRTAGVYDNRRICTGPGQWHRDRAATVRVIAKRDRAHKAQYLIGQAALFAQLHRCPAGKLSSGQKCSYFNVALTAKVAVSADDRKFGIGQAGVIAGRVA